MLEWLEQLGMADIALQCVLFYAELVIGVLLFAVCLKRRRLFVVRLIGCITVALGFVALAVWLAYMVYEAADLYSFKDMLVVGTIAVAFLFLQLFVCVGMVKCCFAATWWECVFCGVCGYSVQHIVYRVNMLFMYYAFFEITFNVYSIIFLVLSAAGVYALAWLLFARRLRGRGRIEVENKKLVGLLGIVLIVMMLFGGMGLVYVGSEELKNSPMMLVECGMALIVCGLTLFALRDSVKVKDMEAENRRLQWMWRADRRQYEISRNNVEQLNVKYHDLKYMLRAMRGDAHTEEELEDCLRLYEAVFRTGNETLDVVLTEKSMLASRRGVNIIVTADGSCLAGIDPVHLYSLFGNALDNAVECLEKVDDADKKSIYVTVRRRGGMAEIRIENYTPRVPDFAEGLPVTTKDDAENHGFGMLSMRSIAKRYGGSLRASVSDDIFTLLVLIPLK